MKPWKPLLGVLSALATWIAVAYAVRYGLMEHRHWVGACAVAPAQWACVVRQGMGTVIHWNLLPLSGLGLALLGWAARGHWGRRAAVLGLVLALPGLVLYTTSLAAFAVMLAAVRWVGTGPGAAVPKVCDAGATGPRPSPG